MGSFTKELLRRKKAADESSPLYGAPLLLWSLMQKGLAKMVESDEGGGVLEVDLHALGPFDFAPTPIDERDKERYACHEIWVSGRYHVYVRYDSPCGWSLPDKDGNVQSIPVTHLSIKRNDRESMHDWRDFQTIKNLFCGEDSEAIEIYPSEQRLVDTSNQYHLWVFPSGLRVPVGFQERLVATGSSGGAKQRPFELEPKQSITSAQIDAMIRKEYGDADV